MLSHAQKYREPVNIIVGEHFLEEPVRNYNKTIVFDLDETIGHFKQLYCLQQIAIRIHGRPLDQGEFNQLIDLYPEMFRVGIFSIFALIWRKKKQKLVDSLYIYTNNKCEGNWVKMITSYISSKVCPPGEMLFDDHILAFKIRNQIVEIRRTSDTKTYTDLVRCMLLPEADVEVCFIDNTEYTRMCERKVYYIIPSPYYHSLKKAEIMRRFFHWPVLSFAQKKRVETEFKIICTEVSTRHPPQTMEATRKIMYYVREYLLMRKIVVPKTNKTRRLRLAHGTAQSTSLRHTEKRKKLNN